MTGNVHRLIAEKHDAKNRPRSAPNNAGAYLEEFFSCSISSTSLRLPHQSFANSSGLLRLRLPSFLHEYWERTVHRSRISPAALVRSFLATVNNLLVAG